MGVGLSEKHKILVVDDEKAICEILKASLEEEGYSIRVAHDGFSALKEIRGWKPEVVLLDIWMPGEWDGLQVLQKAQEEKTQSQFVMMSGHGTVETAVRAVRGGAWDFIEKPLSIEKILIVLRNLLAMQKEQEEKRNLLTHVRKNIAMVGETAVVAELRQLISRVASTSSWILINGEAGTGKELVAQNIHFLSTRAGQAFVEINCAAVLPDLLEAELFGFEKGSMVGAERTRRGKLELAHGGTLFFDEVSALSLEAQEKIMRFLQENSFTRVGGADKIQADVRVMAASSKDLYKEVQAGRFREDLYYRLNVIPIRVPTLFERAADIPLLVEYFGDQICKQGGVKKKMFSEQSLKHMQAYVWPGNIRELRNFVERVYILTPSDFVDVHDLKFAGLQIHEGNSLTEGAIDLNFRDARARFEREYLLQKIAENQGNISKTAELIGLERSYLHRKIKSYGIEM